MASAASLPPLEGRSPSPHPGRDSTADADASLKRKRPRLNDDGEASDSPRDNSNPNNTPQSTPPPMTPHSPFIELVPPDEVSDQPTTFVIMDDDPAMEQGLIQCFPFISQEEGLPTAEIAAVRLAEHLRTGAFTTADLDLLTQWLESHVTCTTHLVDDWRHELQDRKHFWNAIAKCVKNVFNRASVPKGLNIADALSRNTFGRLSSNYAAICSRIFRFEIDRLEQFGRRRDSVTRSVSPAEYDLFSIPHLRSLYCILCTGPFLKALVVRGGVALATIPYATACNITATNSGIADVAQLFDMLCENPDEIQGGRIALKWCLDYSLILLILLLPQGRNIASKGRALDSVLDICRSTDSKLLPKLCKMQPDNAKLHDTAVHAVGTMLDELSHCEKEEFVRKWLAGRAFDNLGQGARELTTDAVGVSENVSQALCTAGALSEFPAARISAAWKIQAYMSFVRSSIISIRVFGVEKLNETCRSAYAEKSRNREHELQCLAGLLRRSEILEYLMGPESHPDLVRRCGILVTFLIATGRYLDADTDLIWSTVACSPETELLEAGYTMIHILAEHMDTRQLMYLAHKLLQLPLEHFGKRALDLLGFLTNKVVGLSSASMEEDHNSIVEISTLCTRILQKATVTGVTPHISEIQETVKKVLCCTVFTETTDTATQAVRLQVWEQIVRSCFHNLQTRSQASNGSVQAVTILLEADESGELEETLSVEASPETVQIVSHELFDYITQKRSEEPPCYEPEYLVPRVQLLLRLLRYHAVQDPVALRSMLWEFLIGEQAISNEARNDMLMVLNAETKNNPRLQDLFMRCMIDYLPTLPPQQATPSLIDLFVRAFTSDTAAHGSKSDFARPVLVTQILRLYLEVPGEYFADNLASLLLSFLYSETALRQPKAALSAQLTTARTCLEAFRNQDTDCTRASRLLRALLLRSSKYQHALDPEKRDTSRNDIFIGATHGDVVRLLVIARDFATETAKWNITTGTDTTLAELSSAITDNIGFRKFSAFAGGKRLDFASERDATVCSVGLDKCHALHVQKVYTPQTIAEDSMNSGSTAVENEVLENADLLLACLDHSNAIAEQAYSLLCQLTLPHPSVRAAIASPETEIAELFPSSKKWKTLYAVAALRMLLHNQLRVGVADEVFILHAVHLLVGLLTDRGRANDEQVILVTIRALVMFLNERPTKDLSSEYFQHPTELVSQLLDTLRLARQFSPVSGDMAAQAQLNAAAFVTETYQCLLQAVRLDESVRKTLVEVEGVLEEHQHLLLSTEPGISQGIANQIVTLCSDEHAPSDLKVFFWNTISSILIEGRDDVTSSLAAFFIAPRVLMANEQITSDETELRSLIAVFSSALLHTEHHESVETCVLDFRIRGFTMLLRCCIDHLRSFKKALRLESLATELFNKFLFTPKADDYDIQELWRPVMNPDTRTEIYELILSLCDGYTTYNNLLEVVSKAVSDVEVPNDYRFTGRSDLIRSECGYVGLENLSQTCYMNSLLQQLFMNIDFRRFILETPVGDTVQQVVLKEFQNAFAALQGSYRAAYSPEGLAKALDVDITVQEDAHIFFTTMIGKLEDSMPNDDAKKQLKSFFGGRNKSQTMGDCGHVSESTDDYYNLSLVVKDKANLSESLQDYVQGDVLDGGDKFKCLRCDPEGAYVNAMRRTGLEHIPDNLALGLKRFRYETWDGGTKVNDRFEFPEKIDMAPYKLEHLANPDAPIKEDVFELVGVIVHMGTLQFGHYWSYARQRSVTRPGISTWFKLEDRNATPSSLEEIMRECSGGTFPDTGAVRSDNAYVLFYQRAASMVDNDCPRLAARTGPSMSPPPISPKVSASAELERIIMLENDNLLRLLHLSEKPHITFICKLIKHLSSLKGDTPAQHGEIQRRVMLIALSHLHHFVTRSDAMFGFDILINEVKKLVDANRSLAHLVLCRIWDNRESAGHYALHTKPAVRQAGNELTISSLERLPDRESTSQLLEVSEEPGSYISYVRRITEIHEYLRDALTDRRAIWREYLAFVSAFASLGLKEAQCMLESKHLLWCLTVLYMEGDETVKRELPALAWHMANGRRYPYAPVVDCIYRFLTNPWVDLRNPLEIESHVVRDDKVSLSTKEWATIVERWDGRSVLLLEACEKYEMAADQQLTDESIPGKLAVRLSAIHMGMRTALIPETLFFGLENTSDYNFSYLRAALQFCLANTPNESKARVIAGAAQMPEVVLRQLTYPWLIHFMKIVYGCSPVAVLHNLSSWIIRSIRCGDEDIEQATVEFLREHIFDLEPVMIPRNRITAMMDYYRAEAAIKLVNRLRAKISVAIDRGRSRDDSERLIEAFQGLSVYLTKLHHTVIALDEEEQESSDLIFETGTTKDDIRYELHDLAGALKVEMEEGVRIQAMIRDWVVDEADEEVELVTRSRLGNRRVIIEGEDEDEELSEVDLEEWASNGDDE